MKLEQYRNPQCPFRTRLILQYLAATGAIRAERKNLSVLASVTERCFLQRPLLAAWRLAHRLVQAISATHAVRPLKHLATRSAHRESVYGDDYDSDRHRCEAAIGVASMHARRRFSVAAAYRARAVLIERLA